MLDILCTFCAYWIQYCNLRHIRFANARCRNQDPTPAWRQSKTSILSTNVDRKSLETEFSIDICRPTGDKWQLKTLFLAIFDPRSSIVKSVFDCHFPRVDPLRVTFSFKIGYNQCTLTHSLAVFCDSRGKGAKCHMNK